MTRPPEGTVLVNIGDMMHRWTSDKFLSTVCFYSCGIDITKQKVSEIHCLMSYTPILVAGVTFSIAPLPPISRPPPCDG